MPIGKQNISIMKFLRRLILSLGVVFLVLLILLTSVFYVVKHLRIKEIVEDEIELKLGIKVTIKKIDFSPLLAHIAAQDVTIHNPKGFAEDELAYIKSIHFGSMENVISQPMKSKNCWVPS